VNTQGWSPYLLPYGGFLVLAHFGAPLPLKVALPLGLFGFYALRGSYPELAGYRPGVSGLAGDVLFGVALAALWMGPYLLLPALPRPEPGAPLAGFDLGLRLLGFAGVTPFVEELFVRSFLLRYVDVFDKEVHFLEVPIGRFAWRSFVVTSLYFALSHLPWEWAVALPTGVLLNLWLYQRRHLCSVVVAHAVANASIWLAVVLGPGAADGSLWFFL
jgi:CAAX prenyl protease-like protein